MSFADRLREALGGQSPAAVARAAGFTKQTMDGYLKGSIPSADRALALADALDVPLRWLITGQQEPGQLHDLDDDWQGLPQYPLYALREGAKPVAIDQVPIHRDWLNRTAAGAGPLWITQMPSSTLDGVPSEGDMIVCCDATEPHGEGLYLYRYHDVPVARRFVAQGIGAPGVLDVSMFGVPGMAILGRVLGAIKMQPAG